MLSKVYKYFVSILVGMIIGITPICLAEVPLPDSLYNPDTGKEESVRDVYKEIKKSEKKEEKENVPDIEKIRKERKGEGEEIEPIVPMGSGNGTWYNIGAYPGNKFALLYTKVFVYPVGGAYLNQNNEGYPNSWLYSTALTRTDKSIELVGMNLGTNNEKLGVFDWSVTAGELVVQPGYTKDTGHNYKCILSHTAATSNQPPNGTYWQSTTSPIPIESGSGDWVSGRNYQEPSIGPDGTYNKWQLIKFLTETIMAKYISSIVDDGGHTRQIVYYVNDSTLIQDGEPQTRRNTIFLWNYPGNVWDAYYYHYYRRNTPNFSGGNRWGPIIEFDNVSRVLNRSNISPKFCN